MPIFLYPVIYVALRQLASTAIDRAIMDGIDQAAGRAVTTITAMLKRNLVIMAGNVMLILCAVYLSGTVVAKETSILVITTVYLSSVLDGAVRALIHWRIIFTIGIEYKMNLFEYIRDQIHSRTRWEVEQRYADLDVFHKAYNWLFGESPQEVAYRISSETIPIVIGRTAARIAWFVIASAIYIAIFRLYVAPLLVADSTGLTIMQALLYPFAYSIDYLFNTTLAQFVAGH